MSKEFEEIVLKKLEKLDVLEKQINSNQEGIEKLNDNFTVFDFEINKKIDTLEKQINSNQEGIKKLNDNFTVFDFEINRKIDTLFDAITVNNEKHDLFEKSIVSLNTKIFNHDIRLSVLEDYNKNSKIFATN